MNLRKPVIFYALLGILLLAGPLCATQPKTGQLAAGIMIGPETGANLKFWINHEQALDLAVGSSGLNQFSVHADYLFHRYKLFTSDRDDLQNNLPIYYGVGGVANAVSNPLYQANNVSAGVRGVVGITYLFIEPFDVFLELAPTALFGNTVYNSGFLFQGALGGRYYF